MGMLRLACRFYVVGLSIVRAWAEQSAPCDIIVWPHCVRKAGGPFQPPSPSDPPVLRLNTAPSVGLVPTRCPVGWWPIPFICRQSFHFAVQVGPRFEGLFAPPRLLRVPRSLPPPPARSLASTPSPARAATPSPPPLGTPPAGAPLPVTRAPSQPLTADSALLPPGDTLIRSFFAHVAYPALRRLTLARPAALGSRVTLDTLRLIVRQCPGLTALELPPFLGRALPPPPAATAAAVPSPHSAPTAEMPKGGRGAGSPALGGEALAMLCVEALALRELRWRNADPETLLAEAFCAAGPPATVRAPLMLLDFSHADDAEDTPHRAAAESDTASPVQPASLPIFAHLCTVRLDRWAPVSSRALPLVCALIGQAGLSPALQSVSAAGCPASLQAHLQAALEGRQTGTGASAPALVLVPTSRAHGREAMPGGKGGGR